MAIRTGVSFVEIVEYVRTEGIDLVIMATHGRGGLQHIIIGSAAEKVVRKSPCPVLTIRPAKKQFKGT
jgi:nucleotide-binding universal stress UspA family protein